MQSSRVDSIQKICATLSNANIKLRDALSQIDILENGDEDADEDDDEEQDNDIDIVPSEFEGFLYSS